MSPIALRVRHPNGVVGIEADTSMDVGDLVRLVMVKTSLCTETGKAAFRLRHKGVFLKKGSTLGERGLEDDDLLVVAPHTLNTPLMQALGRIKRGHTKTSYAHKDAIDAIRHSVVDTGMKRVSQERLCPGLMADATKQQELNATRARRKTEDIRCHVSKAGPPESGDAPRVNVSVTVVFEGSPSIAQ